MKKFQVRLHGEHFLLAAVDGTIAEYGLYTTRWVEAIDESQAEIAAVELVRDDPSLVGRVRNALDDSPMIFLAELRELPDFEGVTPPGSGYTFYSLS